MMPAGGEQQGAEGTAQAAERARNAMQLAAKELAAAVQREKSFGHTSRLR